MSNYWIFKDPDEEFEDNNPRQCPIFWAQGFHVYARDNMCVDCGKPNPSRTDKGR